MGTFPLFVTAPDADAKAINTLLLYLRAWEYGEEPTWDSFTLMTSVSELPEASDGHGTIPPLQTSDEDYEAKFPENNEWSGSSIKAVEDFMVAKAAALDHDTTGMNLSSGLCAILDSQGLRDKTIIICGRPFQHEVDGKTWEDEDREDYFHISDEFKKTRAPWDKAEGMCCNLDIANMDFVDFTVEDTLEETGAAGESEGDTAARKKFWFTWRPFEAHSNPEVERRYNETEIKIAGRIETVINEYREKGWAY